MSLLRKIEIIMSQTEPPVFLSISFMFPHLSLLFLLQVLVWHTRTEKPHLTNEPSHRKDTIVIEV